MELQTSISHDGPSAWIKNCPSKSHRANAPKFVFGSGRTNRGSGLHPVTTLPNNAMVNFIHACIFLATGSHSKGGEGQPSYTFFGQQAAEQVYLKDLMM